VIQVQDADQMRTWVAQAFAENSEAVQDALHNRKKAKAAAGFLTGQVMRISQGQAAPNLVGKLIAEKLREMKQQLET